MDREKIKKAIYDYSEDYGYGDDLRGALISAIQILDLDLLIVLRFVLIGMNTLEEKEQRT